MTTLNNSIHIAASPEQVWAALARLEALQDYDPGVARSALSSDQREGPGASRRCELHGGGWFSERVTIWAPCRELAFELDDCSLPVRRLRHHYILTSEAGGTRVAQRQDYQLKHGPLGQLLDVLVVRRKWDAGIKRFLAGLRAHVEGRNPPGPGAPTAAGMLGLERP